MFHLSFLSFITHPYFWLVVAFILGVSVVGLFWSMAELTIKREDAFSRLFNLIGLRTSNEIVKDRELSQVNKNEVSVLEEKQQPTKVGDIDWTDYNPQILADISEVRYLFQASLNSQTGEISNLRLLNEGIKKANEFIIKHWSELKEEDRQMFEIVAIKMMEIYRKLLKKGLVGAYLFIGYYFIKRNLSYLINKLFYKIGLKKRLSRPPVGFSKEFTQMAFKSFRESKTDNLFLRFVNYQTIFINNIFRFSGRYNLIDESLYFPEALDKVVPIRGDGGELPWEEQEIISDAYIRRQAALFDALPKEKLLPYKGQYVFFEEGKIKDSDTNKINLAKRVFKKEGYRDVFLEKVI